MPTTRPRHTITETDELAKALELAARRWPEDKHRRGRLLLRVLGEGTRVLIDEQEARIADRLAAIRETAGSGTGLFPPGYLEELRRDWPE